MTGQQPTHPIDPPNGNGELQVRLLHATQARSHAPPTPRHSGMRIDHYYRMHVMGGAFPVVAGVLLFGWRAMGVIAAVMGTAEIGRAHV